MHKVNFAKNMRRFERGKFSLILYSNTTPDKFFIYQVKITFKHLRFAHKAYLTCRKRHNPGYLSVKFLIDYKYQNNLF